jgi:hypothetical protein
MEIIRTFKSKILLLVLIVLQLPPSFLSSFPRGKLKARFTTASKKLLKMSFTWFYRQLRINTRILFITTVQS